MSTNFPASLDTFTNPKSTDALNSPSHSQQHININDAVAAIEAKLGIDNSGVSTSVDNKLQVINAAILALQAVAAGLGTASTHAASDFLQTTNNLSDVPNKATARSNLGAGTSSFSGAYSDLTSIPSSFTPSTHASSHASGGSDPITIAESQVTNLTTDLAALAPLASPTFTGTPAAPTASVDTNTTQLATTAFVIAQASASGDGTPAMDGTAARGTSTHYARADHVHPTDTSLAPKASPTFTGTPAAPTASAGTNTTQLATMAAVQAQGVRAWVNFHWTGSAVSVDGSFNITSVVRNGLGDYTITMTNALPSTKYVVFGSASSDTGVTTRSWVALYDDGTARTTTVFRVLFVNQTGSGIIDPLNANLAVFGG